MLGGLWSMKGNTLFSGPFGTGIGGDVFGVSNSPKMDPLHLFATNQPGGKNYIAAHPGEQPAPPGQLMQTGIDPSLLPLLQHAYMNYMNQLNPQQAQSQGPPQPSPGGNMGGMANLARLQAGPGGGLNGFPTRQFGLNPMFRPQPP